MGLDKSACGPYSKYLREARFWGAVARLVPDSDNSAKANFYTLRFFPTQARSFSMRSLSSS